MAAPGFDADEVLRFAASTEVYSSHVLAGSVVGAAKQRQIPLLEASEAEEFATNGVAATLRTPETPNTVLAQVGKPSWVREYAPMLSVADLAPGELAIYVAADDRFAGAIIMRDQVRYQAAPHPVIQLIWTEESSTALNPQSSALPSSATARCLVFWLPRLANSPDPQSRAGHTLCAQPFIVFL